MTIRIVSDNCCDLPPELLTEYGIRIVNLTVSFGEQEYPLREFNHHQFYRQMELSEVMPKTSQPSMGSLMAVYQEAMEDNHEVIAIHLASGISGTVQGGLAAAAMLDNSRLHIFDSRKASVGQGLLVLEAARMARRGDGAAAILERLAVMREGVQCIFSVNNIEYLIKGGRVSKAKGYIAEVLDIKPILHMDPEGYIQPYAKARGRKGAMIKLLDVMGKMGKDLEKQTVGICHSACYEDACYLREEIMSRHGATEVVIGEIGPVIGSHVGPGTFSVFFES